MHPLNVRRAVAGALFISVVAIGSYIVSSPHPTLFVVVAMVVATAVPTLLLVLIIIRTNRGLRGPDGH